MSNYHNSLPGFVETSSQVTERSVLIANIQMQTPLQWATSFVVSLENQGLSGLSIRATFTYIVKGTTKD